MTSAAKSTDSANSPAGATRAPVTPVTGSTRLALIITVQTKKHPNTTVYHLSRLQPHPGVGYPAWRLSKTDSEDVYDVILGPHGLSCDCRDFLYRRGNLEKGCKHTASLGKLIAEGLLRKD